MRNIPVRAASADYSVCLGSGLFASLESRLKKLFGSNSRKYFVITTPEVWALWSGPFLATFLDKPPAVLFLASGEKFKRLAAIEQLAAELSASGADRSSILLALGGGVIGDVTGFLAAIYMRGIDYVQMPTTLLAQVDSSVGGKTGVNLKTGKNLVGSFHHPRLVLAEMQTLNTLPADEFRAGLFEIIKAGFIRDRSLLKLMQTECESILAREAAVLERIIGASIRMKAAVVGEDEHETGVRMILNFGHTIGHAIEAVAGYGNLLHGEAVGYGMLAALEVSRLRGLPQKDFDAAVALVLAYGLPPLKKMSPRSLLNAAAGDKKNSAGQRRFVLLKKFGTAYVAKDVRDEEIIAGIHFMSELVRQ